MTAATVSTDQGPVDGKPRPHPKKVPPASPRRRSLVRMDDSAVLAWFVGEITTDLRIHCSISVSGSPPTYNSTTLSRPCPSRDFILLPRGLTIVLLVYALWSVSPSLSLCTPARVASLYALPQASAPSQRQPPRPPVRAPSSAGGPARDGATKRGLVSPQTWIRLTCKASTRPSVDARRCAVRRRSSDGAMTVRCGAGRSVQGRDERHLLPLS